ncbi:MAG: hypothetical protein NTZ05_14070, partial [Chloroflexi bacterium]|nr:hypothetical protein [Chloroflexota bacterium]
FAGQVKDTYPGKNLPPGVHEATWSDLVGRYGYTPYRLALLSGVRAYPSRRRRTRTVRRSIVAKTVPAYHT